MLNHVNYIYNTNKAQNKHNLTHYPGNPVPSTQETRGKNPQKNQQKAKKHIDNMARVW